MADCESRRTHVKNFIQKVDQAKVARSAQTVSELSRPNDSAELLIEGVDYTASCFINLDILQNLKMPNKKLNWHAVQQQ